MNETLAQKALRVITPIPKEDFIVGRFSDNVGRCCFIGHYVRSTSDNPEDYSMKNCMDWGLELTSNRQEALKIRELSERFLKEQHDIDDVDIACINNFASYNGYTEPDIKDRVTHLLEDMIKAGL